MKTVSNQELTIRVSEHGAELSSIVANATGKEYLWQADPAFWKRHSPVLFPIVGSVWKAEYRNEGTVYPLSQHGFARDMDFTLIDEAENELRFALESTPDTLRAYPFPFLLEIGYRLEGNKVEVLWRVKNTGDKTMHFQIGAHPAFLYPNYEVDQPDRGYFAFDVKKDLVYRALVEKGCVGDVVRPVPLDADGLLPLNIHTFDIDTFRSPLRLRWSVYGLRLRETLRLSVSNLGMDVATGWIIRVSIKTGIGYGIWNRESSSMPPIR